MATETKKIINRRDTAARWKSANPILANGEIGIDTTNGIIKVGDGTTAWNNLPYQAGQLVQETGNSEYKVISQKAVSAYIRDIFARPRAVGVMNLSVSMAFSTGACDISVTRTSSAGYLYFDGGYFTILDDVAERVNYSTGVVIVYIEGGAIKSANGLANVPKSAAILEAFYAYEGIVAFMFWTSPFISKTGVFVPNSYCAYANPKEIQLLKDRTSELESPLRMKATSLFYGALSFEFSSYSVGVRLTRPGNIGPFLYHEGGFYYVGKAIDKTLTWSASSSNVFIYYDDASRDILLSHSVNDIPLKAILLEAFYSDAGDYTRGTWVSAFAKRNISMPNLYCSLGNPSVSDKLLRLSRSKAARIFQRVGCIGDSYTAGYIKTDEGFLNRSENNAWPHFMGKMTGARYDNWGVSGSTAKGWVLGAANLAKVKEEGNKCQAYVIGLMINDRANADWNSYYTPVGVPSDIGTDNDTYYAYYYKLVQEVVAVNPQAKIFCATCPKWSDNDPYNAAVANIVSRCNDDGQSVYLLDYASSKYAELFTEAAYVSDYINGHYTAIGYEHMAECCMQVMSDVISDNVSEFQDVAFIPFDEV